MAQRGGAGVGGAAGVAQPPGVRPWAIPEKFDGSKDSDWTSWLAHFQQVSLANGWNAADQVNFLSLYLTGPAQLFYQSLPQNIRTGNLPPLVQALGDRFAPAAHVDLHRAELRARTQTHSESLSDYCEAVRKLSRMAYPTLAQNVQDTLGKEQFFGWPC